MNKRGLIWNETVWWIIAIAIIALAFGLIIILDKGQTNVFERILNLLRFGR